MSINFRVPTLEACTRNVARMEGEIGRLKATDASRLNDEYQRLVNGLAQSGALPANQELAASPVLPADILQQAVPGNLRRADQVALCIARRPPSSPPTSVRPRALGPRPGPAPCAAPLRLLPAELQPNTRA